MTGGTIPARKVRGKKEVKSLYILFLHQKLTIANDNRIVKIEISATGDKKETIVVIMSLCNRYWFAIGTAKMIDEVKEICQLCKSLAQVP